MCYWKGDPTKTSKGIKTEVDIEGDSDLEYYFDIDISKGCSGEELTGLFSAHLTNDWSPVVSISESFAIHSGFLTITYFMKILLWIRVTII